MTKEKTMATKEKEKENLKVVETVEKETQTVQDLAELTPQEYAAYRKLQRDACGAAIDKLLLEYDTDLTARVIVGADAIIPQVFLVDAKPKAPVQ
tara:strand:- start:6175 stop:6459 length:285 start_codon:yes stop_codon:yes gene_type:complete